MSFDRSVATMSALQPGWAAMASASTIAMEYGSWPEEQAADQTLIRRVDRGRAISSGST
jgi:hypothetical protein